MKVALFDFDGTLLRGNSWQLFFWWRLWRQPLRVPWLLLALALRSARLVSSRWLKEQVLAGLRGQTEAEVADLGKEFYAAILAPRLSAAGRRAVDACRAEGCEIALVTGAFDFLVGPWVGAQQVRHWRAVRLQYVNGLCTGRLLGPELHGHLKATAAGQLSAGQAVDWAASRAYGDEAADVPVLALVGRPVFVGPRVPPNLPSGTVIEAWRD